MPHVWLVFREPGGLDSVWATPEDAERYGDDLAERLADKGVDITAERYEVRQYNGGDGT